ncbi:MAG TPA: TIGR03915 family putative DNA repair protein [Spirochaetota bacterium]
MIYVYDGSFNSLLTALGKAIKRKETPEEIITAEDASSLLLGELFHTGCDNQGAERFSAIIEKKSSRTLSSLCTAYLSELKGFEMKSLRFLQAVSEKGDAALDNLADERIRAMQLLTQKVTCEHHRMLGLLRFSELSDGTFYAPFEPDHNITGMIAPHFSKRLPHDWIIHDLRRNIAAIHRHRRWELFSIEENSPIVYSDKELEYRSIWQHYYKEIAIPERKNPLCQRRFMPTRYWKHLTERQTK